jgi:hypothetical protein
MTSAARLRDETLPESVAGNRTDKAEPQFSAPRPAPRQSVIVTPVEHPETVSPKSGVNETRESAPVERPATPPAAATEPRDTPSAASAPAAEPPSSDAEEEVLDIPAFLRRQAN